MSSARVSNSGKGVNYGIVPYQLTTTILRSPNRAGRRERGRGRTKEETEVKVKWSVVYSDTLLVSPNHLYTPSHGTESVASIPSRKGLTGRRTRLNPETSGFSYISNGEGVFTHSL